MPLIRYTYARDVAAHGDQPVQVEDVEARVLVADRRAELVDADKLAELPKAALLDLADKASVEVKKTAPKADIVKAVADKS